jgi:uncharacterized protein YcnI
MARWCGRLGAAIVGVLAVGVLAAAAYAHVEVEVQPAVAGATNATITFDAEAESSSAGISKVQVFLPAGLAPSAVTLKQGPAGWTLTPGADNYTVSGPALRQGVNAVHAITVAQLPNTNRLVFKVLITYSNGSVDRWIEEPTTANLNPDNPAPVVQLSPAAPTTPPATSAAPTTAPAATTPSSATGDSDGGSLWPWWVVGLVLLAAVVGAVALARRRGSAASGGGTGNRPA